MTRPRVLETTTLVTIASAIVASACNPALDLGGDRLVRAAAIGESHACALLRGGVVKCWGLAEHGQLGVDPATVGDSTCSPTRCTHQPRTVPAPSGARWTAVGTGALHTCALADDQSIWCWGDDGLGQLGDGTSASEPWTPRRVPGRFEALAVGRDHACGVSSGDVACWGDGVQEPARIEGLSGGVVAVAAGASFTCATRQGGDVWCWGANEAGQLGTGVASDREERATLVPALEGATKISLARAHGCALRDGTAFCWGANDAMQTGSEHTDSCGDTPCLLRATPIASLADVADVSTGHDFSCAVTSAGQVYCWGSDQRGQLGDSMAVPAGACTLSGTDGPCRAEPHEVYQGTPHLPLSVVAGGQQGCYLTVDGLLYCWGAGDNALSSGEAFPDQIWGLDPTRIN